MTPQQEVNYILHDCFFAVGQMIGPDRRLDFDAIAWLHARYRDRFLYAMTHLGNSWTRDRRRVTAVGRYLGQRVLHHAGDKPVIDRACAARASADVERGCQMNAERDGMLS
jgi:hypothetical protein